MKTFPSHTGTPYSENPVWFAPAPAAIGTVVSGASTLQPGVRPTPLPLRLLAIAVLTLVGAGLGLFLLDRTQMPPDCIMAAVLRWGFPVFGGMIGYGITDFQHMVTYVGEDGLAACFLKSGPTKPITEKSVLFSDVSDLFVQETNHRTNMIYEKTTYAYEWKDREGKLLFEIKGEHRAGDKRPEDPMHPYHFALAAEKAWNRYKQEEFTQRLQSGGTLLFPAGPLTVELSTDTLTIHHQKKALPLSVSKIDRIRIAQGKLIFHSKSYKDENCISQLAGKGTFPIPYANFPNADLFLLLMESLWSSREQKPD